MAIDVINLGKVLAPYKPAVDPENLVLAQNSLVRKRHEAYTDYVKALGFLSHPRSEVEFLSEHPFGAVQKFEISYGGVLKRPINVETYVAFPLAKNPEVPSVSLYSNEDYIGDCWIKELHEALIPLGFEVKGANYAENVSSLEQLPREINALLKFKIAIQDAVNEEETGRHDLFKECYNNVKAIKVA